MRRRLFTLAAGVSAVLCAAALVLLYRSYHTRPAFEFSWKAQRWELIWDRGELRLDNEPQIRMDRERRDAALLKWQDPRDRLSWEEWPLVSALRGPDPWGRRYAEWLAQRDELYRVLLQRPGGKERVAALQLPITPRTSYSHRVTNLAPIVTTLFLPIAWLFCTAGAHRKRVLLRKGLCFRCGYDLRATPDRCPECGALPTRSV